MTLHQSILAAVLGLVSVLALHAASYECDNSDGNRVFTTTSVAPALVDSAWAVTGASTLVQGTANTAYVTVQNGGCFRFSNFAIGAANAAANAGFVTVENGGRISSSALLDGSLFVGGTSVQSAGALVLQAGAITHALPNSVPTRVSRPPLFSTSHPNP